MDRLIEMLEKINLPYAYNHFAEGSSPSIPFICYLIPKSNNLSADGVVYFKKVEVKIELYTNKKDLELEEKVESLLDEYGHFYNKTEVWIETERIFEVIYQFTMEVK